jgi:type II secretory pathway component GspD/PulD (secretin)
MMRILRFEKGRLTHLNAMRTEKVLLLLLAFFGFLFVAPSLLAEEKKEPIKESVKESVEVPKDGFTINYNTVSIIEYIHFASKICNINFIFNEADLNFTVTVVSEAPITPSNVMATLIQVLRIHGLQLLEQGNNLVIHKSEDVKQMATLTTESGEGGNSPIVTRIFRIKNANTQSIAAIIRPMISTSSMLETSVETRQIILTDITANVEKVANLIENLDSPHTLLEIKNYEAQHNKPDYLIEIGSQIMTPIAQGNPFILVPATLANSIYIVSTPELTAKAMSVFTSLDLPPKKLLLADRKLKSENIFVYKVENRSGDDLLNGLSNIADNLEKSGMPENDLIETIDSAKWIPATNSIMFVGSKDSLDKVREFLLALDVPTTAAQRMSFFVYKPVNRSAKEIEASIKEMAHNLRNAKGVDTELLATINSAKINTATHTITFSGEEATFPRVKELIGTIDTPNGKAKGADKNSFYLYKIQSAPAIDIEAALKDFSTKLNKSDASDEGLVQTIDSMKYIKDTNSILFTGPDSALKRLQELLPSFDSQISKAPAGSQFFIYKPKHLRGEQLVHSLKDVTENLKSNELSDPAMLRTLESMKWVKSTNSLLFTGDPASLKRVEELAITVDVQTGPKAVKPGYFLYKLQSANGEMVEDDLDNLAKNFKSSGLKDTSVIDVIENIRYVKETNSLLLTGDPQAIDEVKDLIAKYDYPRQGKGPVNSNFFMYKPQHLPANAIEKSLHDIGSNLKKADLADPSLLSAIDSAKYVETTNSLIFTGPPDALTKIQALIKDVDVPAAKHAPIQHIGKTTFLLVKLKNASGPQITASLRNMAADLKKSGTTDKDFLAALSSMKYVKETNSLLFTGNEEALTKVQALVEKFDVTSLGGPSATPTGGPSNFFVYKPQSLGGEDLEKLMQDFAENLKSTGLTDPDLFSTIASMRWVEKTQSLIFTGTQKSLDQVKDLLKSFDIPTNLPAGSIAGGPLEPTIQAIDNTSFLVYKLQFHKGDEIQGALRQIAKDLILSNAPVNQNLLNSINSIQWLEVTNSLLCSGDQETLTRLRELIKNLDIPLKQVFIEMLVVQTSLANALTFGLEWGGNYKYRTKFAGTMSNTIPPANTGSNTDPLLTTLSKVNPANLPNPANISNINSGFDLGVVGEIIKHNGDSFLTLSSLMSALQTDSETAIVMTPKLITQDGRTSSIFSGQNIPFAGSFVSNTGNNATVGTTNIEYRDIGVNLTITPVLGNSDIVTLDITLDQTSVPSSAQQGQVTFNQQGFPASINGITSSKTTMQTTVHVPDNHFLILSGMVNNSNTKTKTGIPCLGGLPIVGAAFSTDNDTVANSNIVIFLRPHILSSLDDMTRITKDQEDFFRDQTGTPFLERNYEEAMETIKTIDDE